MVLTLLVVLIAGLLGLAVAASFAPPRHAVTAGVAAISGAVVVLAVAALANGGATTLVMPIGPPGAALHFVADPLAASFLLLVFLVLPWADAAPLPLAGVGTALLAGDGFTLALGVILRGGTNALRVTAAAAVCLVAGLALAGALGDFSALPSVPQDGWRATGAMALTLAGAVSVSRISPAIAGYLLLRVAFGLSEADQSLWWGAPLLLAGAAVALAGALRAALSDTFQATASGAPLPLFAVTGMAFGVALMARAVDLPSITALALEAAWLALVVHVLCRTLLSVAADAIEHSAGTRRLDRLGGLIHRMPATAACCLAGLITVAMLPPSPGFAAFWLLFQSLLAAARFGSPLLHIVVVCVAAVVALSVGLMALAAVRLFGAAFLGRPRTPRSAVADEAPRRVRFVLGGLATAATLFGLFPGLALLPAAGWTGAADTMSLLVLRTGTETPGYWPIAVAGLLTPAVIVLLRLRRGAGEPRREPAWSGGFTAPPPWLPFGDPATQYGPRSFVEPLHRVLAMLPAISFAPLLRRGSRAVLRAATSLMVP